jgi:transglutaminase-like putative cysteine protease
MYYSIRHVTRFRYSAPIRESVMELRMQPRSEGPQALRSFQIATNPRAQLYAYTDHLGNAVYHFNVLREHEELRIDAQSVIEISPMRPVPDACDALEWDRYNSYNFSDEHFDLMEPSKFAQPSPALLQFMSKHGLERPQGDPLSALRALNTKIYEAFDYQVGVTDVHSPIDDALGANRGVCQDFAHIMIAIAREWRMPARYVSITAAPRRIVRRKTRRMPGWRSGFPRWAGWVSTPPTIC